MKAEETISCQGHANILALHPTTFEITTCGELTCAGDCVIGVWADKGAADLSGEFRSVLSSPGAILTTILSCGEIELGIRSAGGPNITLRHPHDLVWRRSTFTCDRTIGIGSDCTARTIDRKLVRLLKKGAEMEVRLIAETPDADR